MRSCWRQLGLGARSQWCIGFRCWLYLSHLAHFPNMAQGPKTPDDQKNVQLIFFGCSDDTFICAGGQGVYIDHDNCASGEPIWMRVRAGDEALLVSGTYCPGESRGWHVGVTPDTDAPDLYDVRMPDWPISIRPCPETPYSPMLVIEAPAGVMVELIGVPDSE